MLQKTKVLDKIEDYTKKGFLYSNELEDIISSSKKLNRILREDEKLNIEKILTAKFKINKVSGFDFQSTLKGGGFLKEEEKMEVPNDAVKNRLEITREVNITKFILDNTVKIEGAMGIVQKARLVNQDSRYHQQYVMLKRLKPEFKDDKVSQDIFLKEYQIGIKLDHQNIVKIIEKGRDEYGQYFCMEYIKGNTLRELIDSKKLTTKMVREISISILKALAYMHKNNIFHRDLKPENIIITKYDKKVKIIDFGLAVSDSIDNRQNYIGTADYSAPELKGTATKSDHRADMYSFGIILTEMLTNQTKDITLVKDSVMPEMYSVIDKSTKNDMNLRYENIKEVLAIIKNPKKYVFFSSIEKNIYYIYSILVGILIFALSSKIVPLIDYSAPIVKMVISSLSLFAISFPIILFIFNYTSGNKELNK